MAQIHEIKAESRKDEGKGASRRLRRAEFVPAVVYGAGQPPESIQIFHNTILLAAKNEWFFSSVLDLNIDGKVQKVLVRDWQKHPFKQQMLHMDFLRINENEAVRVNVPLHFLNQDKSPAGKTADVIVLHELNEIEVSCLPKHLPEFIEVDLTNLTLGDIVHMSQLNLPEGVTLPALRLGKEHDLAVVIAKQARVEAEETPADAAAPVAAEVPSTKSAKAAAAPAAAPPAKGDKKK